jgi:S-adenosyl-L-methionine hydrolase (adenosine-forming)
MIHLFSDFGLEGPYIGQVKAVLGHLAPHVLVVDLLSDAPVCDPRAAAYMLAAYDSGCRAADVIMAVVDPGVGSERAAVVIRADDRWYVGPDNGIFEAVMRQAGDDVMCWEILWRPTVLSASFHGRDIFAPIAAQIATGLNPDQDTDGRFRTVERGKMSRDKWPDDLDEVIYIDRFGNLITGLRGITCNLAKGLIVGDVVVQRHRTFADVARGDAFCYENSNGLIEIAVNLGRADTILNMSIGDKVAVK